eukprot:5306990-Amphidinium_carterae.2
MSGGFSSLGREQALSASLLTLHLGCRPARHPRVLGLPVHRRVSSWHRPARHSFKCPLVYQSPHRGHPHPWIAFQRGPAGGLFHPFSGSCSFIRCGSGCFRGARGETLPSSLISLGSLVSECSGGLSSSLSPSSASWNSLRVSVGKARASLAAGVSSGSGAGSPSPPWAGSRLLHGPWELQRALPQG